MGTICRFKTDDKTAVREYLPMDIQGFRFIDDKFFLSRKTNLSGVKKRVFLEYLIKGKMSVFYLRDETGDHYFVEKEGSDLVLLPYTEEVNYIEGKPYVWKSKQHIGILKNMTSDAPVLQSQLEKFRKPNHKNLINLASEYHYEVCDTEFCLVYEKKAPFLKLALEPVLGFIKYQQADAASAEAGIHLFVWIPRANEKLFLKTGFLFSGFSSDKKTYSISKMPLQLQYLYPKHNFQPKLNLGANFYRMTSKEYHLHQNKNVQRFHTLHFGTGFHYKLDDYFFLSTNLSTELNPLSSALQKESSAFSKASHSFNIGLYFKI